MKKHFLLFFYLLPSLLLLSACTAEKTPQEVAQVFWESVINNDTDEVLRYSTLTDATKYDGFSKNWNGFQPSWGRVIIEGDRANIVSEFSKPDNTNSHSRKFITYLIRQNEEWKVDYDRTHEEVHGNVLTNLLGRLDQLGSNIATQLSSTAKHLDADLKRLSGELEKLSDSLSQQATQSVNKYAEILRKSIKEFEESLERALKEQDKNLSDEEKRELNGIIAELNKDRENLSQPSIQSISDSRKNVHLVQQRLEVMDNDVTKNYKDEWNDWELKFETNVNKMLEELSDIAKK